MDEVYGIVTSWQYLVVAVAVFLIFALFNGLGAWDGLGKYLWRIKSQGLRKVLRVLEGTKTLFLPLLGFGLGWIPGIPRPPQIGENASTLSVALLYATAGIASLTLVQFIKKTLKSRNIDIEVDLTPRQQKEKGCDDGTP